MPETIIFKMREVCFISWFQSPSVDLLGLGPVVGSTSQQGVDSGAMVAGRKKLNSHNSIQSHIPSHPRLPTLPHHPNVLLLPDSVTLLTSPLTHWPLGHP